MDDTIKTYKDTWWYRLITLAPVREKVNSGIDFYKELIDKSSTYSSHRNINLWWGCGSFVLYWVDHFVYHKNFTTSDYVFISCMSGISTIAAVLAKIKDPNFKLEPDEEDDTLPPPPKKQNPK